MLLVTALSLVLLLIDSHNQAPGSSFLNPQFLRLPSRHIYCSSAIQIWYFSYQFPKPAHGYGRAHLNPQQIHG